MGGRHSDRVPARAVATRGLWPYVVLVLLGVLPLVVLAYLAQRLASQAITAQIETSNRSAAQTARELVTRDFGHAISRVEAAADLPDFVEAVEDENAEQLRQQLRALVESSNRVVRAFVVDPEGLLWSDYPHASEALGRQFSDRDWYTGVVRGGGPYVSEVYTRHIRPPKRVVAIAAPIRSPWTGALRGILVTQVAADALIGLVAQLEVGEGGTVFLVDQGGMVAAHPSPEAIGRHHEEYVGTGILVAEGTSRSGRYRAPATRELMLFSAAPCDVAGQRWWVVAQQPVSAAFRTMQWVRLQIAGAAVLLVLVVGGLCLGLARFHNRMRAMNRTLEDVNRRLAEENAMRLRVEQELQRSHDELEQRVEQRTHELRQKEEQLLQSQKMEAVGRLAGGVAHDFNNLLTVILAYGDLLLSESPEDAPHREELREMCDAAERAAALTRQLLAFSRKQVLQPQVLDLNQVVHRLEKLLGRVLGEDIQIITRLSAEVHSVSADPVQVDQILVNLAVNARDAMPKGGKLIVETANVVFDDDYVQAHSEVARGPHVMLAVTDTGVGMDAETRAHLFEPFFTTKELGRGTGLGLSTVYGIVRQSGGNIWVYSELGRGTTFKIYLPAHLEAPHVVEPRPTEPAPAHGTETVLVVEDEPKVRGLVVRVLESSGYRVLAAGDADEALKMSEEFEGPIDLLISDVVLPGTGGPQLANELNRQRPSLRILFTSGYTDKAIAQQGVLAPGALLLEKPIRPKSLLREVKRALGAPPSEDGASRAG